MSETMDRTLDEFGSLDGIINNVNPAINELVGGNQRTVKFRKARSKVVITERLAEASPSGTVAYGYVDVNDERWPYREVFWGLPKHRAAVLAANRVHADWDKDKTVEEFHKLAELDDVMLELTGFDVSEIETLQDGWVDHEALEPEPKSGDKVKRWTIEDLQKLRGQFELSTNQTDNGFVDWLSK